MKRDNPELLRQPPSPYDNRLTLSAAGWLKELPPPVVPVALASQFPRIVNRLSRFWDSPKKIHECFAELLVHRRSGRRGFPAEVLQELFALEKYYLDLHQVEDTDTWTSIPRRRTDDE